MFVIKTKTAGETRAVGAALARLLFPGSVVCLSGELGAGKTVFAQGVGQGLGVTEPVRSPTFTLINEYAGRFPLYHFDLYRLDDPADLEDLGYAEYFDGGGVVLIEWPERAGGLLPGQCLWVEIGLAAAGETDGDRCLRFSPQGKEYEIILARMEEQCWY